MDLDAYFARIGYDGPRTATLDVLRALAERQPQTITFENVAVAAGGVPDITPDAIVEKLVHGGRGGYCYEQNTLLRTVLSALGFQVTGLAARVRFRLPADLVTPRGHMILRVDLPDGAWLVDAGFGGLTLTAPVAMRPGGIQHTPHEEVRLVPAGDDWCLQALLGGEWADVYRFDQSPQLGPDYAQQNWYTATQPQSLFRHNVIVTRPVPGGRYALFNRTLTWRPLGGAPERHEVAGADALASVLRDVFALAIPETEVTAAAATAAAAQGTNPIFS